MPKALDPLTPIDRADDHRPKLAEAREIIVPHDPAAGPVTAVRNVLIQASLAELKAKGHYERYARLIAPDMIEQLLASLGPSWIPVEVALAHYEACENLSLTSGEFAAMGDRVGDRVQDTVLVSSAKKVRDVNFDLWTAVPSLHRMWPRIFQGGSIQTVKVGPKEKLVEQRGFLMNRYHYYRQAHVAALRATYSALGARIAFAKIVSHTAAGDETVVHVGWL